MNAQLGLGKGATRQFGNLDEVVGRPHGYTESVDPGRRAYARHLLNGAPLIALRPGRVKFVNTDGLLGRVAGRLGIEPAKVGNILSAGKLPHGTAFDMTKGYGVSDADITALEKAIQEKGGTGSTAPVSSLDAMGKESVRYFDFAPAYGEYMSILATLSGRLYARQQGTAVKWMDNIDIAMANNTLVGGFFNFWADGATSISEDASSEVGQSAVAGVVKGLSGISREGQFFLGDSFTDEDGAKGMFEKTANQISELIGGKGKIAGMSAAISDAILGLNPMFPEVWKDSSFSRSYNLSFKFYSPYGDPMAVFQNVLMPFTMLLSLVLPVMRSPTSYSEPFVFQLYSPGYMACDLGICTGFSFTRGGNEGLFTVQGLPRQIDVTMQVKDLYPVLTASHNNSSMLLNTDLSTFLDNLAGVTLQRKFSDVVTEMKAAIAAQVIDKAQYKDRAESYFARLWYETLGVTPMVNSVKGLFRR